MKLILDKKQLDMNPEQFLRKVGYSIFNDRRSGKESFSRRLGSGFYPKFHIYIDAGGERVVFNLHLDQKQASYAGSHMHNAEYDGEIVENEIERLRELATHNTGPSSGTDGRTAGDEKDMIDKIGGDREYINKTTEKNDKKWWKFW